ncbi:hypothetical protein P0136_10650 [Lentisphaerota bacterium ZTH]|nr:hypothetical protein JYG24_11835 [Lentisphaerota bacterium]WET05820.1 hypothetical protein P0136_10650 [Lentisphaerota bacterium ZTH]
MIQPLIDLNLEQNQEVKYALKHYSVAAEKALKRAVRKLFRHYNYKIKRSLSRNLKVPQKTLKKRLITNLKIRKGVAKGRIWFGANPIPFHKLGSIRLVKSKGGVKAGQHFAKGAFIYNGLVFKRVGVARFPIKRVDLCIDADARRIFENMGMQNPAVVARKFDEIFKQELNFAMNHE